MFANSTTGYWLYWASSRIIAANLILGLGLRLNLQKAINYLLEFLANENNILKLEDNEHELILQFSSVAQSCPTICDPMNHRMPVHRQLLEITQTHVHQVGDTIQPSQLLLSHSPPAPNLFHHQSLF